MSSKLAQSSRKRTPLRRSLSDDGRSSSGGAEGVPIEPDLSRLPQHSDDLDVITADEVRRAPSTLPSPTC